MQAEFSAVVLFSLAGNLSLILTAFLTGIVLTRKYSRLKTCLGWLFFIILHFGICLFGYSLNVTDDTLNLISLMLIASLASALLYQDVFSARVFVSVMAALISNVMTFFFCGTTLSFVDNAPNPYNTHTLLIFNGIKIFWFVCIFFVYRRFVRGTLRDVISVLGSQIKRYVPIPVYTFLAFFVINRITNALGLMPAIPETRILFLLFYLVVCSIFVVLYWEIFSTALWSSRALKTAAELNIASNIQRDMLPNIFPAFPERTEFDIYATMTPAKEVGGDFYDFFMVDPTHLGVVIADVSGKGVPAALFMVIAKTIIRNQAQTNAAPAEVFTKANEQLCENNGEGLFVTAFMGFLDLDTGRFVYVNAGHNPPLLRRKGGSYEWLKMPPGFVLAGMDGMRYRQNELTLSPGDTLFLYTDGVTEATNASLELYGESRLEDALNAPEGKDLAVDELLPYIKTSVERFVNGSEQADDITMLALEYRDHATRDTEGGPLEDTDRTR